MKEIDGQLVEATVERAAPSARRLAAGAARAAAADLRMQKWEAATADGREITLSTGEVLAGARLHAASAKQRRKEADAAAQKLRSVQIMLDRERARQQLQLHI